MRGGGCDRCVSPGCIKSLFRKGRGVVEVDQIVRHAGMTRLAFEDRLQDRRAFELVCIGLVVGRSRNVKRDSVKNLRFVVVGIARRQWLHGLEVGLDARAMGKLVVIGVHDGKGVDVIALALRLGADRLALLDRREAERKAGSRRRRMRVVEQAQRDAPIGNRALGIGLDGILEYRLGLLIPERMLVAHAAVEAPLRRLVA